MPADAVIDNAEDGFTAEEIVTEIYPTVPLDRARRIIEFARRHDARLTGWEYPGRAAQTPAWS